MIDVRRSSQVDLLTTHSVYNCYIRIIYQTCKHGRGLNYDSLLVLAAVKMQVIYPLMCLCFSFTFAAWNFKRATKGQAIAKERSCSDGGGRTVMPMQMVPTRQGC